MLDFAPIAAICVIAYSAILIFYPKKKQTPLTKQGLRFVFFLYALALVSVTLFPVPLDPAPIQSAVKKGAWFAHNNFTPLLTIKQFMRVADGPLFMSAAKNIGGNVLMFAPFGFLAPLLLFAKPNAAKVLFAGFLVSLSVESAQLAVSFCLGFAYRSFDVDDILLNTLGTGAGYLALKGSLPLFRRIKNLAESPK